MDPVNSVQVYSLDEEKLKFRVLVSFAADIIATDQGGYEFQLPPLTSFGNSDHFQSCVINLDAFQCNTQVGVTDACWTTAVQLHKVGALDLRMDIPSSQTLQNLNINNTLDKVGDSRMGGYRQLVPLEMKLIGDGAGGIAGVGGVSYGWLGHGVGSEIICGNPFGSKITITNRISYADVKVWLVSVAGGGGGAGGADIGFYQYQFTITMIPNRK
jgi:hypothetical protein